MARTTIWLPATDQGRTARQNWLLQDGSIITHPKLEISGSGRRVRLAGTTQSVSITQVDKLIETAIGATATSLGTEPWMKLHAPNTAEEIRHSRGLPDLAEPLPADDVRHGRTAVFWEFTHPTLGVSAILEVTLSVFYGTWTVSSDLAYRTTRPSHRGVLTIHRWGPDFPDWTTSHSPPAPRSAVSELNLSDTKYTSKARALIDFFTRCRQMDLESIHIPDLRDPQNPQLLKLDFVRTSYSATFDQLLVQEANVAPQMERLRKATSEVISTLRAIGIVVDDMPEKAYTQAMTGDLTHMVVNLQPHAHAEKTDPLHTVGLNLATGTVAVACMHNAKHKDEVAQAYENAKFLSDLKGEQDEFLAYARAYVERQATEAVQGIIDERAALTKNLQDRLVEVTGRNDTARQTAAPSPRRDTA